MALASTTAFAQGEAQTDTTPQAAPQTIEISEAAVDKFIEVHKQVESIRGEYVELLQQADDQEVAMEIQQEAQEKMVKKVEDSGMEVQQYNIIAQAAQQNPDIQKRIQDAQWVLSRS